MGLLYMGMPRHDGSRPKANGVSRYLVHFLPLVSDCRKVHKPDLTDGLPCASMNCEKRSQVPT